MLLMISAGACIGAGLSSSYRIHFGMFWIEWNSASWRVPIATNSYSSYYSPFFVLDFLMPDSPRWLIYLGGGGRSSFRSAVSFERQASKYGYSPGVPFSQRCCPPTL
ncbi:hypothetical protein EJ03DRAFT_10352 [Teratosphaeria nubilosa]|uniref:Major facilitator superfamily (MFS) profile domain-containing protein n=1 Tax=Teratosphaeria nubilosa TaxID=161662 RepID=A0A6G1LHG6_9PEZI|nr:hypothetical protein EJ03DRAFT_10352 [Teratosphaeria nubilosa]